MLVDFWTYTCINWLRTLGYVRAWAERYRDHGLVVVGVHTPEFPFERDQDNVRRAVADMDVAYPVALDPDYAVWQAFSNHYWPAIYIADAEGRIRYHHFGEEAYDGNGAGDPATAARRGPRRRSATTLVSIVPGGVEAQADWANLGSPETYLGSQQGSNLVASDAPIGAPATFAVPDTLSAERVGARRSMDDRGACGGVEPARRTHRVPVPRARRQPGDTLPRRGPGAVPGADRRRAPGPAHGLDVDATGHGTLVEPRLYQLVREPGAIADRTFEITFAAAGVEAYVFTFG